MKNILLATDLAAETDRALERAIQLASTTSAKLHILHVCPLYSFKNKEKNISLKKETKDTIKKHLESNKKVKNLTTTISVIESAEPFLEILNHAEKVTADLIVMGMHGKAKLIDMFVGTTIEKVIRKGIRPVLMVKNKVKGDYTDVMVGTDFSAGSKQAFHVAIELFPKSSFHLIHSYSFPDTAIGDKIAQFSGDFIANTAREKLENFVKENKNALKKHGIKSKKFHFWAVEEAPYSTLIQAASKVKPDLIAIGTSSHPSFMPSKIGGTAKDILVNPPCDVLIARGI